MTRSTTNTTTTQSCGTLEESMDRWKSLLDAIPKPEFDELCMCESLRRQIVDAAVAHPGGFHIPGVKISVSDNVPENVIMKLLDGKFVGIIKIEPPGDSR